MRDQGGDFIQDRSWMLLSYPKCFVASEAVEWLVNSLNWSRDQAIFFGRLLRTRDIIHHTSDNDQKFDDDTQWWRFQNHELGPLNWKQIWSAPTEESPVVLMEHLFRRILALVRSSLSKFNEVLAPDELIVELKKLSESKEFMEWEEDTAVLQKVQLSLSQSDKLSFWINCYNMLALHSVIIATSEGTDVMGSYFSRKLFFTRNIYIISDLNFCLNDIQNGILRPHNPYFHETDQRILHRLEKSDYRIFSALTCFNKSSQAPLVMPSKHVERTLNFAHQQYFQKFSNVTRTEITLPKIFSWYQEDYNIQHQHIAEFLSPLLTPQQINVMETTKSPDVKFQEYSWDLYIDPKAFCD